MDTILIVVTMALSQSYNRTTEYWPVVVMQEFRNEAACLQAAEQIRRSSKGFSTWCAPSKVKP